MAASTATKKSIINHWFEPAISLRKLWINLFFDICLLERSTARINGAKFDSLLTWSKAIKHQEMNAS